MSPARGNFGLVILQQAKLVLKVPISKPEDIGRRLDYIPESGDDGATAHRIGWVRTFGSWYMRLRISLRCQSSALSNPAV